MDLDLGPPGENNGRGRQVADARASGFCRPAPAIGAVQVYNVIRTGEERNSDLIKQTKTPGQVDRLSQAGPPDLDHGIRN